MALWRKLGLVYSPAGAHGWDRSYAHLPTCEVLDGDRLRVYFAALDEKKYGRIGYVDLAAEDPLNIIEVATKPVLDLGELGSFDDCGVVPSCLVHRDGITNLYYIGFQRAERVPYMLFAGLATAPRGTTHFTRYSRTPILDRTSAEPFSRGAPYILRERDTLRMWYWSCVSWSQGVGGHVHYNNVIRHACSTNGIEWEVTETPCIVPANKNEYSIGRPCVARQGDGYQMWYAVRSHGDNYAIGYAESKDGLVWERMDEKSGIGPSVEGWDSEMVCYPNVVEIADRRYMFYNGNGHGRSGFGVAVLDPA